MTLNRKQRRQLDKYGYDGNRISTMLDIVDDISLIKEGEKVKLDVKKITGRADWQKASERYRSFVMENKNTVFTVQYEEKYGIKPSLVTFAEDNTWLWWTGDLIVVKNDK